MFCSRCKGTYIHTCRPARSCNDSKISSWNSSSSSSSGGGDVGAGGGGGGGGLRQIGTYISHKMITNVWCHLFVHSSITITLVRILPLECVDVVK